MAAQQFERTDRIGAEMMREVERVIREDVRDPRTDCIFSITHADVTRDLRYAKIYVSVLEDDKRDDLMQALKNAAGYIRRALGKRMIIRYSPELQFISDRNIAYGVHIAKVLADAAGTEGHTHE